MALPIRTGLFKEDFVDRMPFSGFYLRSGETNFVAYWSDKFHQNTNSPWSPLIFKVDDSLGCLL